MKNVKKIQIKYDKPRCILGYENLVVVASENLLQYFDANTHSV